MSSQGYGQDAKISAAPEVEFNNLHSRLQKQNGEYSELLYSIEDKLHGILNLRQPTAEANTAGADRPMTDFVSTMRDELDTMGRLNSRLQQALDHLRHLI